MSDSSSIALWKRIRRTFRCCTAAGTGTARSEIRFIGMVSNQLRTSLVTIATNTELLERFLISGAMSAGITRSAYQ